MPTLERQTFHAPAIDTAGDRRLVPVVRSWRLSLLGGRLWAVWSRPLAVEVRRLGHRRRLPIRDTTRRAQLTVWLAGLAITGILWRLGRKERRR